MKLTKHFFKPMIMATTFIILGSAIAENSYAIKNKKILETNVLTSYYSSTDIHVTTGENVYIVFNDAAQRQLQLFSKRSGDWSSESKTVPYFTRVGMFSEQLKLKLYTIINEPTFDKKGIKILISVYEIDEAETDLEKPITTMIISADKVFSSERSKTGEKLLLSPNEEGHYLLLGDCGQSKWDPIAIIGTVISGGHAGFANWPFLAEISDNGRTDFHKWPVNYGTNVIARISRAVLVGNKYHFVGTWHRAYMSSHERIEYSVFDLKSSKWSKPEKIYKEKGSYSSPSGKPAIQANDEDIVIAWPLGNDDRLGSGLFARHKINGTWSSTEKISSFNANPILAQDSNPILVRDSNDNICVFWCESRKGILMSSFINRKWSEPHVIVNDEDIVTINVPRGVAFDNRGNLHIVYLRQSSDTKNSTQLDLIYCDLNVN